MLKDFNERDKALLKRVFASRGNTGAGIAEEYPETLQDILDAARAEGAKTYTDDEALTVADYEEVLADHRRLVRELDVLLNGEGGAERPSLCDIVGQLRHAKPPSYDGSKSLIERLREPIVSEAFATHRITDGALAERLIRERLDAASEIERLSTAPS
ncbi:hypothetical protein [Phenylobacterium ferrooxidans]|uniref:Uncharacterized protein n=1 Tax=Phenylobacterium ferrooxidans TaxID=2982689 RepID=A0ABW6CLP6_9CAUL